MYFAYSYVLWVLMAGSKADMDQIPVGALLACIAPLAPRGIVTLRY
jgi:aldehyde:ferredoxin oxidoreductase